MKGKPRTLPAARQKYYVGDPVVVVTLANYERLMSHLGKMSRLKSEPQNVQTGLIMRNSLLLKEGRRDIKEAKKHYKIDGKQDKTDDHDDA